MTTVDRADARQLLTDFDAAAAEFFEAFAGVPEAALGYRPEADDYALSGLLIHIAGGLEYYGHVLTSMVDANFEPISASGAPSAEDQALIHDGIAPSARGSSIERIRLAHARLVQEVQRAGDVNRAAQVRFGEAAEPLATSAADLVGWMRDHYREHVAHIDELLTGWRAQAG